MKARTLNLIYLSALIVIIVGGVFLLYGDVYFWITGNHLGESKVAGEKAKKSEIPTIDTNELTAKINSGEVFLLLDVRTTQEFTSGHIKQAVNLPLDQIDNQIGKLALAKSYEIITMCDGTGCNRSDQAAAKLIGLGFSNVKSYHDGITAWQLAGKPVVTTTLDPNDFIKLFEDFKTKEISISEAKKKIDSKNVTLIDVQTQQNNATAHIDGAIYMDLGNSSEQAASGLIPKTKPIIFYSEDGLRSKIATQAFLDHGYKDVYNMAGGLKAWKDAGNTTKSNN